jgi:hypothetical protein
MIQTRYHSLTALLLLSGCILVLAGRGISQTSAPGGRPSLKERHTISLILGVKTNTNLSATVSAGKVNLESGFVGFVGYGYWFEEDWQLGLAAGVLGTRSDIAYGTVSAWSIVPVLFGVNYYPTALTMGKLGRPYIGASGGPYIGTASWVGGVSGTGTTVETVPGGRFVLGVDLFFGGWFRIGPAVAYHVVGKFKEITPEHNFSGTELSLTLGALL